MTQPTPAPPAPAPISQYAYYTDIENIHWQIEGEQPGTASAVAMEWISFAIKLAHASQAMKDVATGLADWESPEAKQAYQGRSDEATQYLDDAADTALTVGLRVGDLSDVMADGQERMQDLYEEYQAAITEFDSQDARGQYGMRMDLDQETGVSYLADGTNRGRFKAHYDQRAIDLSRDIATTYNEPNTALYFAAFPGMVPLDYVFHPGGMGMPFVLPGGPGAPVPPPGTVAPGAPPTSQIAQAPPGPLAMTLNTAAPPPGTTQTNPDAPAEPPASSLETNPPVDPPGTTASTEAPPPALSPVLPPGAVITPGGLVAPPGTIGPPGGRLFATPGTARLSGPAGAQLLPGAQTLGIESAPPGVLGAESAGPPPPGALDPNGPPGVTIGDPGPPGAGTGLPPGMGSMGMPPGMGMGGPPPPANAARQRNQGSTPPGMGTTRPASPNLASAARSGLPMPPGAGMGMPPGTGMMPPGTGAGSPPPDHPAARNGRATTPPGAVATPGTNVPEAFLPPTGFGPPVLGDPQQQRQRARPGGGAEAPLAFRAVRSGPSIGGGTPPILVNRHQTGPRQTHTQRRAAERFAHQERMKQFREMLKSVFAKDLPERTAPVLAGRPATPDGHATARIAEIPPALHNLQRAIERNRQRRLGQPADRATRRLVTEHPTSPATEPGAAAWEVETPGGPVVAGERRKKQRRDPAPRALGGNR